MKKYNKKQNKNQIKVNVSENEKEMLYYLESIRKDDFIAFAHTLIDNPLWKKAQKSNEFKKATLDLIKQIKEKTLENSEYLNMLFLEGESKLSNEKSCIYNTCLEIAYLLEKVIEKWKNPNKKEVLKTLFNISCRLEKLEMVIKCLEKYFSNVNQIEQYVQVRIILADFIRMIDGMIELYETNNNVKD